MSWNGSGSNAPAAQPAQKPTAAKKSPSVVKGIVAGLAVVVIGVACVLMFSGKRDIGNVLRHEMKPQSQVTIKEVAVAPKAAKSSDEKNVQTDQPKTNRLWLGKEVVREKAITNNSIIVETYWTADGKEHKYIHSTTKPIFDNGADQILALVTQDKTGNGPPLPALNQKQFENELGAAVLKPIVINDDDSEAVKEVKQRVIDARKAMLEAMAEGKSALEVIAEDRAMKQHETELRNMAVKGLKELMAAGDEAGAKEYCEKMNAKLEQMGLMKIEIPTKKKRRQ